MKPSTDHSTTDAAASRPLVQSAILPFGRLIQSILVGITMAVAEMRTHRLRSALSVLGVLLGVASLVAMLTLIGGIDVFLHQRMSKWAGSIWIWTKPQPEENEVTSWSRSPGLRYSDGTHLERQLDEAQQYYRSIERHANFYLGGVKEHVHLRGMDERTMLDEMEHVVVRKGRMIETAEFERGDPVCLLSWEMDERVKKQLGREDADSGMFVGEMCRAGNTLLKITGVFWPADPEFKPWGMRRAVFVPVRTMQQVVTGFDPDPGSIRIGVADPDKIDLQSKQIANELIVRHRGVEDFEYNTADWLEDISRMLNNAAVLMSIVSVISLLVGGMSIMNVMLSSIAERIHEIGVRKALGAKSMQIFVQFIAESMTLCFAGGTAGALVGLVPVAFKEAIKRSTDGAIEPTVLPQHVVFVFCIITVVGVVFGLYPAFKAVRMDPVEALRYE